MSSCVAGYVEGFRGPRLLTARGISVAHILPSPSYGRKFSLADIDDRSEPRHEATAAGPHRQMLQRCAVVLLVTA